ncbi:UNVERIFIED_CONTAM: hypothetical protein PYX00_003694 [Menopon gallinae]|uniref:Uncharacterized protein n=1 Tax=Menopon gallinae TaxID=328185 RepID=A0AAW2I2X2_9NEOP
MGGRTSFCCFPIEIAVRIIGTVNLIIYAFAFTLLCSGVGDVLKNVKIRIILGLDSRFFVHSEEDSIDWLPVFYLVFCAIYIISSTLLIGSSITRQRLLTAPWLLCSVANIIAHLGSFALLAMSTFSVCDKWVTVIAVLYTVLTMYFCIVIIVAQYSWRVKEGKRFIHPKNQDIWEDIFRPPPPPIESPYKNQI